ncbi:MAG: DUF998 domain-containing protein [Kofleriaceae bacterium]
MVARCRVGLLVYATLQFVALTAIAMWLYPRYRFTGQFFSELGAARTWRGEPNRAAAALFALALASLGLALIGFASAWPTYAFARRRSRAVGVASQVCGTVAGLAFVGVAATPIDRALDAHNALVAVGFAALFGFVVSATSVWWRNGAPVAVRAVSALYIVVLLGCFAATGWGLAAGLRAHLAVLVIAQKLGVYASVAYVGFLTTAIWRGAPRPATPTSPRTSPT